MKFFGLPGISRVRRRFAAGGHQPRAYRVLIGLTNLSTLDSILGMHFGKVLRQLRAKSGLGIKKLAPELGVSYSYLSKLENNEVGPSEDMIARVAKYFDYDGDRLLLSAGKVPQEVLKILQDNPDEAIEFLKERFGRAK